MKVIKEESKLIIANTCKTVKLIENWFNDHFVYFLEIQYTNSESIRLPKSFDNLASAMIRFRVELI